MGRKRSKDQIEAKLAMHSEDSFFDAESVNRTKTILARHKKVAAQINDHDTWPNADGSVEILDDQGLVTGSMHVQVKRFSKSTLKYSTPTSVMVFAETVGPILLLCVDNDKQKVYWLYFDEETVKSYDYKSHEHIVVDLLEDQTFSEQDDSYAAVWRKLVADRKARVHDLKESVTAQIHRRIDSAKALVTSGRFTAGLSQLKELKDEQWDNGDSYAKFRIISNIAAAQYQLRDYEQASANFLEAYNLEPTDKKGRTYKALSFFLKEDYTSTLREANKVLRTDPVNTAAASLKIQAMAQTGKKVKTIIQGLDETLLNDAEILNSLGFAAHILGEYEQSLSLFEKASPETDDADSISNHAIALLERALRQDEGIISDFYTQQERDQIKKAYDLLRRAWDKIPDKPDKLAKANWLLNIAAAARVVESDSEAIKIADELIQLDSLDGRFIKSAVGLLVSNRRYAEAEVHLRARIAQDDPPLELYAMLSDVLLAQEKYDAAAENASNFLDAYKDRDINWSETHQNLFEIYLRQEKFTEAQQVVDKLVETAEGKALGTLLAARLSRTQKDSAKATALLEQLSSQIANNEDKLFLLMYAEEAFTLGLFNIAAQAYEKIVRPTSDNLYAYRYLLSLFKAEKYEQTITVAKQLRETSGISKRIVQFEWAAHQELKDLPAARKILQEYSAAYPEDLDPQIDIAIIDARSNRLDLVDGFLAKDLDYSSLSLQSSIQLANLYRFRELPQKAMEILYDFRRRFDDDPEAHQAYVTLMMGLNGTAADRILEIDSVEPDTAMLYDGGHFIIESTYPPKIANYEIDVEEATKRDYIGKKVGDSVVLTRNQLVGAKEVEIIGIKSKFLFMLHDTMQNYERRFPGRNDLMGFNIEETGFDPIFKQLKIANERGELAENLYREGKISVDVFARMTNNDPINIFYALRQTPDLGVKNAIGVAEEIEEALKNLNSDKLELVTDFTSIITLFELGMTARKLGVKKFLVAQTTVDLVSELINKEQSFGKRERSTLYEKEGEYHHVDVTDVVKEGRLTALKKILKWIESNATITAFTQAQYDVIKDKVPGGRKDLEEIIHACQIDTLRLASGDNRVLLSDDFTYRRLASNPFGVKSVWTQILVAYQVDKGKLGKDELEEVTIKLANSNYHYVAIGAEVLLRAARQAGWQLADPLVKVVAAISRPETDLFSMVKITVGFLYYLYIDKAIFDRRQIVHFILSESSRSHETSEILRLFKIGVTTIAQLDQKRAKEISDDIDVWSQAH
jgi:tetratricopeptide (TPR) repeat protein